jgi:hypothetical protein
MNTGGEKKKGWEKVYSEEEIEAKNNRGNRIKC